MGATGGGVAAQCLRRRQWERDLVFLDFADGTDIDRSFTVWLKLLK
jgi:hypothetical protein